MSIVVDHHCEENLLLNVLQLLQQGCHCKLNIAAVHSSKYTPGLLILAILGLVWPFTCPCYNGAKGGTEGRLTDNGVVIYTIQRHCRTTSTVAASGGIAASSMK